MSKIEFAEEVPVNLLREKENKDVLIALLVSGAEPADGLEQPIYETNTSNQIVIGKFAKSNRTTGCQISYTVGNPSSLANNALEATITMMNREFFGENVQEYLNRGKQSPEEFVSKYLNGVMGYFKYDMNIFKQEKVPRMVANLNQYAQILAKQNKLELSSSVSNLASLMQKVANEMGVRKEQAKPAQEAAEEKEVPTEEASPVNTSNPNS